MYPYPNGVTMPQGPIGFSTDIISQQPTAPLIPALPYPSSPSAPPPQFPNDGILFFLHGNHFHTQNNHFLIFKICHPRTKRQCMVQVKISNQNTRCLNEPLLTQAETNYCLLIFYCLRQYYRSYSY